MVATFFYHNERYTAPREDAIALDAERRIFVAADGVTRDWDAIQTGEASYPNPSPATLAADAVASATLEHLQAGEETDPAERLSGALRAANAAVGSVNRTLGLAERHDYLERDFAGAVAAASVVLGDTLYVGWIGDCGVAVVRDGALAYLTRDQLDEVVAFLKGNPAPWDDARRVFIRRDLRNRPDFRPEGRPVTYGVLTGEPDAASYIETAAFPLRSGDVVATHTDGFRPYFADPEFLAGLCEDPARWREALPPLFSRLASLSPEHGRERSLVLYRHSTD